MKDNNCAYCMRGELVEKFGYHVCDLPTGSLYIFKEQSHPGRCILAYKDHVSEMIDISDSDRAAYFDDVARVAQALHNIYHPAKVNYGMYGDTGHHLHVHIVPKYDGEYEWGSTFAMNPDKKYLTDAEYEEIAVKYRKELGVK